MNCLHRNSLYSTLDSISESLFSKSHIPQSQRVAAARWIASRQGLPGSYAGMFAPTEIGPELAKSEMQYAALYWRNNLKKFTLAESSVARRRATVGQRLLELCEK